MCYINKGGGKIVLQNTGGRAEFYEKTVAGGTYPLSRLRQRAACSAAQKSEKKRKRLEMPGLWRDFPHDKYVYGAAGKVNPEKYSVFSFQFLVFIGKRTDKMTPIGARSHPLAAVERAKKKKNGCVLPQPSSAKLNCRYLFLPIKKKIPAFPHLYRRSYL